MVTFSFLDLYTSLNKRQVDEGWDLGQVWMIIMGKSALIWKDQHDPFPGSAMFSGNLSQNPQNHLGSKRWRCSRPTGMSWNLLRIHFKDQISPSLLGHKLGWDEPGGPVICITLLINPFPVTNPDVKCPQNITEILEVRLTHLLKNGPCWLSFQGVPLNQVTKTWKTKISKML